MSPPDDRACPERDQLVQFLLGHLPEPELETLEQHLSACPACGDTLQALNAEDTLVRLARSAQAELPEADAVDDLIPRVRRLLSDPTTGSADGAKDERAEGIRRLLRPPQEPNELGHLATYRVLDHLGTGATGVVAASSGNHGVAVAHAAQIAGLYPLIFVPEGAAASKLEAIEVLGAEIRRVEGDPVLAESAAREHAVETGLPYLSPYNDAHVVAGQGTIGVELASDLPRIDILFASMGGGGLVSGAGGYLKGARGTRVVACSSW